VQACPGLGIERGGPIVGSEPIVDGAELTIDRMSKKLRQGSRYHEHTRHIARARALH
jgi:hypothetical protein